MLYTPVSGSLKDVQDIVPRACMRDSTSGGQRQLYHAEIHTASKTPVLRILDVSRGVDVGAT